MSDYKWKPIEPLSDRDRQIDLAAMRPLYETWEVAESFARWLDAALAVAFKEYGDRL